LISSKIKYYLRPLSPINYEDGHLLTKKKKAILIQDIFFNKIEVISRRKLKIKKKIYSFPEFFKEFKKNKKICELFNNLNYKNKTLKRLVFKDTKISIFGILNITPDSFSDGGKNLNLSEAVLNAQKMVNDGASFIDIGGESTRPGAKPVSAHEEISRVLPVIQRLNFKKIDLSLDTRNSSTMEFGITSGVKIINDVSGLTNDRKSLDVVKKYSTPVVVMHMPGTPQTMMKRNKYNDVVLDVYDFLNERIKSLTQAGLKKENIIVDPGIGFGKNYIQNIKLIKNLSVFHSLGVPLMLGVSRKRFIESISSKSHPEQRLGGTIAATLLGMTQGIKIHRVHNVQEISQALIVFERLFNR
jgi:dihydropteroate synthase